MKRFRNILMLLISVSVFGACSNSNTAHEEDAPAASNENVEANATLTVSIEGMTCAVGCAKTIQKAVAEIPGVAFSEVNFDESQGIFSFDNTQVQAEEIIEAISGINEGAYKTTILSLDKEIQVAPEAEEEAEEVPA